jgi:hypothetical protein
MKGIHSGVSQQGAELTGAGLAFADGFWCTLLASVIRSMVRFEPTGSQSV